MAGAIGLSIRPRPICFSFEAPTWCRPRSHQRRTVWRLGASLDLLSGHLVGATLRRQISDRRSIFVHDRCRPRASVVGHDAHRRSDQRVSDGWLHRTIQPAGVAAGSRRRRVGRGQYPGIHRVEWRARVGVCDGAAVVAAVRTTATAARAGATDTRSRRHRLDECCLD